MYVTGEGVILVDCRWFDSEETAGLMAKIRSVTDQPVKYVFITHYHQDHIGAIVLVKTRDRVAGLMKELH
jgi:glyoxylase-like metal-dependent hydrolase (beta-lactamase superfamily II)